MANEGWRKGLRQGKYQPDLPARCAVEMNIVGVPTCVLNSKYTKSATQISYRWRGAQGDALFTFSRTGDDPFPTAQHALYLDILLAMFANNFNEDGVLRFRFSDVLRNAGKPANSSGARKAIKEAIYRYQKCHSFWQCSFDGADQSWAGSFISESTLFDDENRNPRNSSDRLTWHKVRFHHLIVDSMNAGKIRLFYSEMLKSGLKHDTYIVYRHLRRFTDKGEIKRSIQQLVSALNYQSKRSDRFKIWLSERLCELQKANYLQAFTIHDSWVSVTLTPVSANGTNRPLKALVGDLVEHTSF